MFSTINTSIPVRIRQQPSNAYGDASPFGQRPGNTGFLRFGFRKHGKDLPDWTRDIAAPAYSMPDLWPLSEALASSIRQLKKDPRDRKALNQVQRQTLDTFRLYMKIQNELLYKGIPYLPKDKREQVKKFRHSFRYQVLRIVMPRNTHRKLVMLQGPAAVKRAQKDYQLTEKLAKDLNSQLRNLKKVDGLSASQKLKRLQIFVIFSFLNLRLKWVISTNKPLGNKVPGLPKQAFKPQIEALLETYNKDHGHDPIRFEHIRKNPIASGSMGQIFLGETRSGKKMVIKTQREAPERMDGYLPYIYFCKTVLVGAEDLALCLQEAEKEVSALKDEADGRTELKNAEKTARYIERQGLKRIRIALPLAATEGGLIMPFVGKQDLLELNSAQQTAVIRQIAPALLQIQICSPNKLADLYFPNIRLPMPAYLIDHGRSFSLDPSTHRKLLKIVTLALASPNARNEIGEDPSVQRAVRDLLGNAHGRRRNPQKLVDTLLGENPLYLETNTLSPQDLLFNKSTLPDHEPPIHVLSFWSNYLTLCTPDKGFPPLGGPDKMSPAVQDLNNAHTKFKSALGVGFAEGEPDTNDDLESGVSQATLQQRRKLAGLEKTTQELAKAMIRESGLSGQLTAEQRKKLKTRLNIALYCDLTM